MNFARLDEQDDKTAGATKRAEGRIIKEWIIAILVVLVVGMSCGTLTTIAVNTPMNVWLGLLVIAVLVLLVGIAYKIIDKAVHTTYAEFRKLEGFISIATMNLVQEIESEKK